MTATSKREVALLKRAERNGAGAPMTIFLRDLAVNTTIGVSARERRAPRTLMFDIELELRHCRAGASDRVADTIDYAEVAACIRARLEPDSFRLLERVAEIVAELLLDEFGADRVAISVAKTGILRDVGAVGVRMQRARQA
jgi:dihydroneopterin aldolase